MQQNSDRWNEVSRSAFEREKLGLELFARAVPNSPPYRVWANFEFQDGHGQWREVDAMVVGQSSIHLLELKSYRSRLGGDEHRWVTDRGGRIDRMRSPLLTTRRKAQRLKSKFEEELVRITRDPTNYPSARRAATEFGRVPWIQEAVFRHNPELVSVLPGRNTASSDLIRLVSTLAPPPPLRLNAWSTETHCQRRKDRFPRCIRRWSGS